MTKKFLPLLIALNLAVVCSFAQQSVSVCEGEFLVIEHIDNIPITQGTQEYFEFVVWIGPNGLPLPYPAGHIPNITTDDAGTYTFEYVYLFDSIVRITTVDVEVKPSPKATINASTEVLTCSEPSTLLTASGGVSYKWSDSLDTPALTTILTGIYSVTVTGENGCTNTASIEIFADITLPSANISPSSGILTDTTPSILLTASGGETYQWNNGLGNSSTVIITSAGTYTVTVIGANGCTSSTSITIAQNGEIPVVNILQSDSLLNCNITSITLTAITDSTVVAYIWNNGSTTPNTIVTSAGTYTVTVTGANGYTAQTTVSIFAATTIDSINGLTVTQQNNALLISWQTANASHYQIYRNDEELATVTTTTYNDTNVENGETYCYTIKAIAGNCEGALSEAVCEMALTDSIINYRADISGKILYQDSTFVSEGNVSLYLQQSVGQYILIETVEILNDGSYIFIQVETGEYIVKAIPSSSENALPTYYGNVEFWDEASIVTVINNTAITNINIWLIPTSAEEDGEGSISGYVEEEEGGKSMSKSAVTRPAENVDVRLQKLQENDLWTTISQTFTNAEGYFEFKNIASGKYKLMLDVPGLEVSGSQDIDLNDDDIVEGIGITITEDGIFATDDVIGICSVIKEDTNIIVYPNPTAGKLRIVLAQSPTGSADKRREAITSVEIYDITGRTVGTHTCGRTDNTIDISNLPSGIYLLRVGNEMLKIVKQ